VGKQSLATERSGTGERCWTGVPYARIPRVSSILANSVSRAENAV
jgi:hypothetical protein